MVGTDFWLPPTLHGSKPSELIVFVEPSEPATPGRRLAHPALLARASLEAHGLAKPGAGGLRLPICQRCKYEPLGLDILPPELLESMYRDNLQKRVAVAIARLQGVRSQRRTELLLNLSQGYISRLSAGDGVPSAPLVSLLALLAAHPQLIGELEAYWTLPPGG